MTISGPAMHRLLMDGYKGLQQRLEEMRTQMHDAESRRDQLG